MTLHRRTVACEYSSFYVAGSRDVNIPIGGELRGIRSSAECINVSCLIFQSGDVNVSLADAGEAHSLAEPVFDGMLATPEGVVLLFDANMPEICSMKVPGRQTRVRVWTNHPTEPDEIEIVVG
ncbi:hypothetical protein [Aminobacter sp. AP02]|uniref:hypothetical protein n=1 Tax=Aminobacter sp. AP02 TaxID=2135737 RepID=UPI000D7925FA|nr:hypothetical protein [Aminobacter sp. AP02]PWK63574.1 hypothetical protein C8K44_12468 [Aminobacter sp. AP02]